MNKRISLSSFGPVLLGFILSLAVAGCGGDTGGRDFHVQGTVTYKGQPIPRGYVTFDPIGQSGSQGFANIVDGKFDTSSKNGKGTVGGTHKVLVTGYDGKSTKDNEDGKPMFEPWSTEVNIPQEKHNTMDFDVDSTAGEYKPPT